MKDKIKRIKYARLSQAERLLYKIENKEIYIKCIQSTLNFNINIEYYLYCYNKEYIMTFTSIKDKTYIKTRNNFLNILTLFLNDIKCQIQELKYSELNL